MIEISTLISVLAVVIAGIGTFANVKKGNKSDAAETATIIVKLESISNDIKELKNELQNIQKEIGDLRERVVIAEQSAKALHKRVDSLEKR